MVKSLVLQIPTDSQSFTNKLTHIVRIAETLPEADQTLMECFTRKKGRWSEVNWPVAKNRLDRLVEACIQQEIFAFVIN